MKNFDIVVIGAGLYVCGKGTSGFGTILPGIFEWKRQNQNIGNVHCVATSVNSAKELSKKAADLTIKTGVNVKVKSYPQSGERDPFCYRKVLRKISKPSCAIVAVPDHLHHQVAKDCLEAGLHVLLVKPFTPTHAEGEDLVNIARKFDGEYPTKHIESYLNYYEMSKEEFDVVLDKWANKELFEKVDGRWKPKFKIE